MHSSAECASPRALPMNSDACCEKGGIMLKILAPTSALLIRAFSAMLPGAWGVLRRTDAGARHRVLSHVGVDGRLAGNLRRRHACSEQAHALRKVSTTVRLATRQRIKTLAALLTIDSKFSVMPTADHRLREVPNARSNACPTTPPRS